MFYAIRTRTVAGRSRRQLLKFQTKRLRDLYVSDRIGVRPITAKEKAKLMPVGLPLAVTDPATGVFFVQTVLEY